jgi:hypothetical protein
MFQYEGLLTVNIVKDKKKKSAECTLKNFIVG